MDAKEQLVKISCLKCYPLQHHFYDTTSPEDDATLAADLAKHGQRDAVHVMPPNNKAGLHVYTILDGHRRVEQLALNGATHVRGLIRHDLADADAATVELEFLGFNMLRRQLHPIDKARIALRLFEIEKKRKSGVLRP